MKSTVLLMLLFATAAAAEQPLRDRGFEPGERVAPLSFRDLSGNPGGLDKPRGWGLVLITRDAECPVSQRYEQLTVALAKRYGAKGFDFVMVDVTPHDVKGARESARKLPGTRTVLEDATDIVRAVRAESTAEAFVIDAGATLQYRGAIDDQYGIQHQRPKASEPWLERALESTLRGERPQVTSTKAHGCPLPIDTKVKGVAGAVTYHNAVSRIVQSRCQACHRTGGLAPMPLETYRQVSERRAVIELMVSTGRMPPWSADRKIGHFANDRSLTDKEKAALLGWIKAGAPEGDAKDAPLPRKFASGWNIGKPDLVIAIPDGFMVPAQGAVDYKNFYIKTNLPEDKWVTAIEIKPTQAKVVHHALAYLEEPGRRDLTPEEIAKLMPGDLRPPSPNNGVAGFYAATVPGSVGIVYPDGMGKKLPKGAWVKVEIHYQPNGTELLDRTQVGFRFAEGPLKEVESLSAFNHHLKIPPHASRHEVKAEFTFERSGQLLSFFPHMHFRGAAFRYDLKYPDGKVVPLLHVPRFDFGWQSYYQLAEPILVPKGATLLVTGWFDNSKSNPWNPDPSREVLWGQQTTDEMMIGYFDFAADSPGRVGESRPVPAPRPAKPAARR
jgi:hypothetical protein